MAVEVDPGELDMKKKGGFWKKGRRREGQKGSFGEVQEKDGWTEELGAW